MPRAFLALPPPPPLQLPPMSSARVEMENSELSVVKLSCEGERNMRHETARIGVPPPLLLPLCFGCCVVAPVVVTVMVFMIVAAAAVDAVAGCGVGADDGLSDNIICV